MLSDLLAPHRCVYTEGHPGDSPAPEQQVSHWRQLLTNRRRRKSAPHLDQLFKHKQVLQMNPSFCFLSCCSTDKYCTVSSLSSCLSSCLCLHHCLIISSLCQNNVRLCQVIDTRHELRVWDVRHFLTDTVLTGFRKQDFFVPHLLKLRWVQLHPHVLHHTSSSQSLPVFFFFMDREVMCHLQPRCLS